MLGFAAAPEIASAVPSVMPLPSLAVFGRGPVTNVPRAAVQPAHGKRFSLPLLPRQLLAFHEIERAVDHMKRLFGLQLVQLKIILGIKAGKQIRLARARAARRGKICADQPVAIDGVEGKCVRVNEKTHHDPEKQRNTREKSDNEESSPCHVVPISQ